MTAPVPRKTTGPVFLPTPGWPAAGESLVDNGSDHLVLYGFLSETVTTNQTTGSNLSQDLVEGNGTAGGQILGLPPESQTVLIILYTLTTLLSVVGNAIVIVVFTVGKRSRTDLRGFLINLAIADLIMAVFCMPFTFTMVMLSNWVFSEPMCPIVLYMQTVSVTASVCTNMAIGIDRFWVVTFPLKSRITKSRSKVVIGIIWCISLVLSSVQLAVGRSRRQEISPGYFVRDCNEIWPDPSETWRRIYTFFILILTYLMPLGILSFTYGFVGWKLWQRTTPGNADEARDSHQLRSKRKVIKMLVVVVVLFGICWLPLHSFILILDFHPGLTNYSGPAEEKLFIGIYYSVHWLAMSNSFVNPIIYGFLNDSFRNDLRRLWRIWFPCCRCLSCLTQPILSRDSTLGRSYFRPDPRKGMSSGSIRLQNDSSHRRLLSVESERKQLNVRLNGSGRAETEIGVRESLLRSGQNKRDAAV